jgi:hypothetical protein
MNLALGPLLVLLLLLPGIAYHYVHTTRADMTRRDVNGFSGDLIMILMIAMTTHLLFWMVLDQWMGWHLYLDDLLNAVSGTPRSYAGHEHEVIRFLGYCTFVVLPAGLVAWIHRKIRPQRVGWDWIIGRRAGLSQMFKSGPRYTDCFVDVLCEVNGRDIIYQGLVKTYYLNNIGNLERLVLNGVLRTTIAQLDAMPEKTEEEYDKVYRSVAGDDFVIFASCIKNINVTLVQWDPWDEFFKEEYISMDDDENEDEDIA